MHDPLVVAFDIPRPWPHRVGGRWRWPSLVTVWHVEPGGADAGTVCRHYRTEYTGATLAPKIHLTNGWQLHVHHWRLQVHPLQRWRRRLLTRCAGCGGRSYRARPVNVRCTWDGARAPWWRGERGLFHHDCAPAVRRG